MFDHFLQPMTDLPAYIKKHGPVEPTSFYINPYSEYHNAADSGLTTWEIMSKDPEKLKTFQIGLTTGDAMVPVVGYYDFNQLALTDEEVQQTPDRVSLVDIGGGVGNVVKRILDASPSLNPKNIVLEDLAPILEMSEKENVAPEGVRKVVHDFWTPQPIQGKPVNPKPRPSSPPLLVATHQHRTHYSHSSLFFFVIQVQKHTTSVASSTTTVMNSAPKLSNRSSLFWHQTRESSLPICFYQRS